MAVTTFFGRPLEANPSNQVRHRRQPTVLVADDSQSLAVGANVGVRFGVMRSGRVLGVSYWRREANMNGPHVASLWNDSAQQVRRALFPPIDLVEGWNSVMFPEPFEVTVAQPTIPPTFFAAVFTNSYSSSPNFFSSQLTEWNWGNQGNNMFIPAAHIPIHPSSRSGNGVFSYGNPDAFPDQTFNQSNYFVDVIFEPS